MPRVAPADLDLWFTTYVRQELAALALPYRTDVDNKEPRSLSATSPPLIVIRADPGSKRSAVSFDASVGVSVLAGSRQNDQIANDLARLVFGILTDDEIAGVDGSPIAAIVPEGINGPYAVAEPQDKARRYFTVQYVTVGTW